MFDFLNYRNKIPISKVKIGDIPRLNPNSSKFKGYWKGEKRNCIEGRWVEHDGLYRWVSGPLHFYVNHWHILLNKKGSKSKTKSLGKPFLRDLEWIKTYIYAVARGFSGFEDDDHYSCHRALASEDVEFEIEMLEDHVKATLYSSNGELKKYKPALEYLYEDKKLSLGKALYQNMALNVIDVESRGLGKDIEASTLIHGEDLSYPIRDVKIGDRIYGRDGKLTTVIDRRDFYDQMQYKVTLSDGRSLECGEGHLWTVRKRYGKGFKEVTLSLGDMLQDYKMGKRGDARYYVPIAEPVEYKHRDLPIDPYYFGLWLGDGCKHRPGITTMDQEIVDYVYKYAEELGYSVSINHKVNNKASTYFITANNGKKGNSLLESLKNLNVRFNKHIPDIYLKSSIEQRLALLQGLMDSDGYGSTETVDIVTSDDNLKRDIPILLSSLGIRFKETTKKTKCKDATKFAMFTELPVFRLPRKLQYVGKGQSAYSATNRKWSAILSIAPTEVKHSVCIAVDNADSLFLAGERYIVTHNSYLMAALCAHNFLFDGAMDYDEYLEMWKGGTPLNSETLIGAIDTKYSIDLISKIKLGIDNLEGGVIIGGISYPAPLSKKTAGSLESGKTLTQKYQVKVGGSWEWRGSMSKFQHRSFNDNPFAANGTRPGFSVLDEIGFFYNLEPALGQMAECTADGSYKFGSIWMTGTGGDMEGGATEAAKRVFYDPRANSCMEFDDIFEGSSTKIGLFVPAWMGLNQFKDELGNTNRELAMRFLTNERERKMKAKSKKPLNDELQQRPIKPSEAFLISGGNIFDSPELTEHLKFLETSTDGYIKGRVGKLVLEGVNHVTFQEDFTGKVKPCDYPLEEKDDLEGAVQIWKTPLDVFPDGNIPYGAILATLDPYAQDEAPNSISLGSMQIFARSYIGGQVFDEQLAEYTGRASSMSEFFETCRKLLIYYNALCLYENNYNQFKTHLQNKNSLHYLAKTPTALKKNKSDNVANTYGLRMTGPMKDELEKYTSDWLIDNAGDGKLNLHHIYSVPLLKELKSYNDTGNFDRVIALCLFVAQKLQMAKIVSAQNIEKKKSWWLTHKFNGV